MAAASGPLAKTRTKTVTLSQSKVPVYYDNDEEALQLSKHIFTVLDADGSGFLCQGELKQAQSQMLVWSERGTAADDMLENMSGSADKDGDNRVDNEEWHTFFRTIYEMLGRKQFMSLANKWVSNMGTQAHADGTDPNSLQDLQAGSADAEQEVAAKKIQKGFRGKQGKAGNDNKKGADLKRSKTSAAVVQGAAASKSQDSPRGPDAAKTTDDIAEVSDAELNAAATKIQKTFRGKQGRKQAVQKKGVGTQGKSSANVTGKLVRAEQKCTSISELWDLLMLEDGHLRTRLNVEEFVHLFIECKVAGLRPMLVKTVPMNVGEPDAAENVSAGEVAHLSMLLIERKDLTFEEAQLELEFVKESCREIGDQKGALADRDAELTMRMWKKILEILSRMMRIDMEYIISTMMWLKTSEFEMTETLAGLVMERALRKDSTSACQLQFPDLSCLEELFSMNYMMNLAYNGGIVDPQGTNGILGSDLQLFFKRIHSKMPELLQRHADRRKQKFAGGKRRDEHSLFGRTEIEVLFGELFKEGPLTRRFGGPLDMVVHLLQSEG